MDPYGLSPEEQQRVVAEALRSQQALRGANQSASKFDNLAAISQLINNDAAATSAAAAQKSAAARAKPLSLGGGNFAIPDTGEFIQSPMAIQDRLDTRAQQRGLAQDRLLQAAQIAEQSRASREAIAAGNQQTRLLAAAMAQANRPDPAEKQAKILNDAVTKFSGTLEKGGIPEFQQALGLVEQNLSKYPAGKLPGYGRFLSALPNALLGNEAQGVRADMAQAANILLKSRSGSAVSKPEERRFLQEVATGAGMDEETARRGWANIANTFNAKKQNALAGASPDVLQEYMNRNGMDLTPRPFRNMPDQSQQAQPSWLPPGVKLIGPAP